MESQSSPIPVGVFDSGVGGLSVLRAIHTLIPSHPLIYFADQAHVPYGVRTLVEVRKYAEEITRYLISEGAGVIVVACNTASAAALHSLRKQFQDMSFVGMEPAVKPAAETTRSGVVGVLATPATFQGELYASVIARFSRGIKVLKDTCPGLVSEIETGNLDTSEIRTILLEALQPMIAENVDTIVLGCTHYPFVMPLIEGIVGPEVNVIDPAPAVARQTRHILHSTGMFNPSGETNLIRFITSGNSSTFKQSIQKLLGWETNVDQVLWIQDKIRSK